MDQLSDITVLKTQHINSSQHQGTALKSVPTCLPVKHVVGFNSSDLGDCGEDVSAVDCCSLQAVTMIDLPLTSLLVNVELHTRKHIHIGKVITL